MYAISLCGHAGHQNAWIALRTTDIEISSALREPPD
jgi:hypothetical protein